MSGTVVHRVEGFNYWHEVRSRSDLSLEAPRMNLGQAEETFAALEKSAPGGFVLVSVSSKTTTTVREVALEPGGPVLSEAPKYKTVTSVHESVGPLESPISIINTALDEETGEWMYLLRARWGMERWVEESNITGVES